MYVSPTTNDTYIFNNTPHNFIQAEQTCNDQGGHLVTYMNHAEQKEVEAYYIRMVSGRTTLHCSALHAKAV